MQLPRVSSFLMSSSASFLLEAIVSPSSSLLVRRSATSRVPGPPRFFHPFVRTFCFEVPSDRSLRLEKPFDVIRSKSCKMY